MNDFSTNVVYSVFIKVQKYYPKADLFEDLSQVFTYSDYLIIKIRAAVVD